LSEGETRAWIDGPHLSLEPNTAQTIAVTLHELAPSAAKYWALSVPDGRVQSGGRVQQMAGSSSAGPRRAARPFSRPSVRASVRARCIA
jgi:two-component sensor histidine kinase